MQDTKKSRSRRKTHKIVTGTHGMKKLEIKEKYCKKCGLRENLEIHHEIYPISSEEIREAILEEKIYFLCKYCHKEYHKKHKVEYNTDQLIKCPFCNKDLVAKFILEKKTMSRLYAYCKACKCSIMKSVKRGEE